jgi:hypothetical protein
LTTAGWRLKETPPVLLQASPTLAHLGLVGHQRGGLNRSGADRPPAGAKPRGQADHRCRACVKAEPLVTPSVATDPALASVTVSSRPAP